MKQLFSLALLITAFFTKAQTVRYIDSASTISGVGGTSWATASNDIQATIEASNSGDQIWVKKGTYKPYTIYRPGPVISFEMKQGVSIYGGFAGIETALNQRDAVLNTTILKGNGERVFRTNGVFINSSTVLDGFTITGGTFNDFGGAMYNYLASPTISNCIFSNNASTLFGGGAVYNNSCSPVFLNCSFTGNSANSSQGGNGGVMYNTAASPTITNCTFTGNSAGGSSGAGGVIYNRTNAAPVFTNCTFSGNSANGLNGTGGAVYNESSSGGPVYTNCTFLNNSSTGFGGAVTNSASGACTISDCVFNGNTAKSWGGAIMSNTSNLTINNCFFSNNAANGTSNSYGGAIANNFSAPSIRNSVFSGNFAKGFIAYGGAIYNSGAATTIVNCLFVGNTVSYTASGNGGYGAAICNSSASASIINCTFNKDSAIGTFSRGAAVYNFNNSSPVITNCILWGDIGTGGEIVNSSGAAVVTYSDVQGGYAGAGNVNLDPKFFDVDNPKGADGIWKTADDGLKTMICGPAINTGNNTAVPVAVTTDITGAARIQQAVVDMGAYEGGLLNTIVWLGISDDWALSTNWSSGTIPDACCHVVVNSGTPFMPLVSGIQTCYGLTVNTGATVTLANAAVLNIIGK